MKNENQFYIRILSPVHIGCDEVYEPMGFVVDEAAARLTAFDPLDFFRSLGTKDREHYNEISGKGTIESIMELYKFMRGKQFSGHTVGVCSGLLAQYKKTLSISAGDRRRIQQELNNFSISRTSFSPATQKPFIPGSAVKGALRTAYLNIIAGNRRVQYDRRDRRAGDILEKELLDYQRLENDPFRLLKVSDFHPADSCRTKIIFAVNEKKTLSKHAARGPYQILEMIEPGSVFTGTIEVLAPLGSKVIKTPLTKKAVFESAYEFFGREKKREDEELRAIEVPPLAVEVKDGTVGLRIGRHSGAESVTIEGHRNIRIMGNRGQKSFSSKGATTFWLASESAAGYQKATLKPFGWVALGQLTEAMAETFKSVQMEEASEDMGTAKELSPADTLREQLAAKQALPVEETWEGAYVSFNAGGGGVMSASMPDGRKAELRGKDKALAVTSKQLHKRLFQGKKSIPAARVDVRKTGNRYEIIRVELLDR